MKATVYWSTYTILARPIHLLKVPDKSEGMALAEQPIYGMARLGVAYNGMNDVKTYVYELTDHLGNVRAVFTKNGADNHQVEGYTDYYPGGMAMPNRQMTDANGYRYGYQGQYAETDPETGKPTFELRLYDPRINRWLGPDPYKQYASPYLAMGNNWISRVDPDGGIGIDPQILHQVSNTLGDMAFFASSVGGYNNFWEKIDFHMLKGVTLEPDSFFLSFDGERSPGRSRVDGTLSLIRTWPNQPNYTVDNWPAISGSGTLLPIPNADDWEISNFNFRDNRGTRNNDRMTRDGVGFSIDITPDPRWGRSLLRIHPDGGQVGTQGCIGLTCGADRLTAFENAIRPLLTKHGSLELKVSGSYNGPDGGWNDLTGDSDLNQFQNIHN